MKKNDGWCRAGLTLLALALLVTVAGCGSTKQSASSDGAGTYTDSVTVESVRIVEEAAILSAQPDVGTALLPVASGTLVQKNDKASIDYSNTADGYVMAQFSAATAKKLKAQVKGPSGTVYTYDLKAGSAWTTFPLSDGNGGYKVSIYENISGTKYATVLSVTFQAAMKDEFAPFLRPNQYVDYTNATSTTAKAAVLCKGLSDPLDKVEAVYHFVVSSLKYDKTKAATVKSGYLPVLDTVLAEKKGICFDYAALMTAMLRSEGVPCKLVVGYAGTAYHAWISVWTADQGWINAAIYFDGKTWQRMDPTFASSAKESKSIMKYIGNGSNYTAKYLY